MCHLSTHSRLALRVTLGLNAVNCANISHARHCPESGGPWSRTSSHVTFATAIAPFGGSALSWRSTLFIKRLLLRHSCQTPTPQKHRALRTRHKQQAATSPRGRPLANRTFPSSHPHKHSRTFLILRHLGATVVCNRECTKAKIDFLSAFEFVVSSALSVLDLSAACCPVPNCPQETA